MNIPDGNHPVWRIAYVLALAVVLVVLLSGVFGNYERLAVGDIVTLLGMVIAATGGQMLLSKFQGVDMERKIERALRTETPKPDEMDSTVESIATGSKVAK